jgi:hypothetical protein
MIDFKEMKLKLREEKNSLLKDKNRCSLIQLKEIEILNNSLQHSQDHLAKR